MKKNEPTLHCTPAQFILVYLLASRILTKGIYFNESMFANPTVSADVFKAALVLLSNLITTAKGNTNDKKSRNAASKAMYKLLKLLLPYVSALADGDINIIVSPLKNAKP